jgi:ABC-type Mn2+/Zn2+ transport system ATPase subunit
MRTPAYLRQSLDRKLADYRAASQSLREDILSLDEAENNLIDALDAQNLIQRVAKAIQQEVHHRISSVVCRCLEAIFDDPYEFRIDFEQKRGKTEAVLKFIRDGLVLDDPIRQAGGGVINVASFALRLASLLLQRPALRPLLVLDEPFGGLRGKKYRSRVRTMLQTLSQEMGVQFIICIDHEAYPEFLLGKVVEL